VDYYPKIGMTKHNYCFYLDDLKDLKWSLLYALNLLTSFSKFTG
jgi:hypothetical protein